MVMNLKNFGKFFLILVFGAVFFVSGFYFGRERIVIVEPEAYHFGFGITRTIDPAEKIDFSLFGEAYYFLKSKFPNFEEIPQKEFTYDVIRGLVKGLNDPHSAFFDPKESEIFSENVLGEFGGIGVEIGIRNNRVQVISPLPETPAFRAGMESGDIIIGVDGESIEGASLDKVVQKIRGPAGEAVKLDILRDEQIKEFEIVREIIEIPTIEWEIVDENIAHIQIFNFHQTIERDFLEVIYEIKESSAEKIVLDLRGNPGGILDGAVNVAGHFVNPKEVILIRSIVLGEDDRKLVRSSVGNPLLKDYPAVVLINEGSASASEIVAGALRDIRNIPIIGKKSFGKGSIQTLHDLSDGSKIKITEEYFLTPEGHIIYENGIKPDIEVEITDKDREKEIDPQLKKAIEIIKEK